MEDIRLHEALHQREGTTDAEVDVGVLERRLFPNGVWFFQQDEVRSIVNFIMLFQSFDHSERFCTASHIHTFI